MIPATRPISTRNSSRNILRIIYFATKWPRTHKNADEPFCALGASVGLFSRGFPSDASVVDVSGKFAWQFKIIVDDIFEMHLGGACIGEQNHEAGLAFVLFVLGDPAVMHAVAVAQTLEHLRL